MTNLKSTTLSIAVHRADANPVFGEGTTHVSLQDDAGGPFIAYQGTFRNDMTNHAIMAGVRLLF